MSLCHFFKRGKCRHGAACMHWHPPTCKKWLKQQCRAGNRCILMHRHAEEVVQEVDSRSSGSHGLRENSARVLSMRNVLLNLGAKSVSFDRAIFEKSKEHLCKPSKY
eukprot:11374895-Karenia_brevis.AAC.1